MIPAKYWSPTKKLMLLGAMAGGKAVEDTATGNPLAFLTDLAKPLKSLLVPFTPKQTGSGDPSPSNIRPIVPWDWLTVFGGGKNLFNKDDPNVQLNKRVATGGTIINSQYSQAVTGFIPVKEGAKYIINNYINQNYFSCFYSDKDITKPVGDIFGNDEYPKTAPKGAKYLIVTISNNGIDGFQIEVGTTATAYEPYVPITETDIVFPSPVYGGTLDAVTGVLTVEWYGIVKKWSEGTNVSVDSSYTRKSFAFPVSVRGVDGQYFAQQKCNIAKLLWDTVQSAHFYIDASTAYVWLPNDTDGDQEIQLVSKLVTPQEIQLTPQQITALVGNNTIWSDANGQLTAVYLKKA